MPENCLLSAPKLGRALARSHPQPTHRILVVDDDEIIRRVNTAILTHAGYDVDSAEDGSVAWDALQQKNYDLLVTDNNMPKMTGVDLLKKVHGARMALPVVMATGISPEHEFARHPWIQPSVLLLKPHTSAELVGAVRNVLFASDRATDSTALPPPDWPGQPSADAWQL